MTQIYNTPVSFKNNINNIKIILLFSEEIKLFPLNRNGSPVDRYVFIFDTDSLYFLLIIASFRFNVILTNKNKD